MNNENFDGLKNQNELWKSLEELSEILSTRQIPKTKIDPNDDVIKSLIDPEFVKIFNTPRVNGEHSKFFTEEDYIKYKNLTEKLKDLKPSLVDFGRFLKDGEIKTIEPRDAVYDSSDSTIFQKEDSKDVIHLFTSNGQSNLSNQTSHLKAKSKANLLGFNKSKVELLDLENCVIKNTLPEGDEDKMSYMSFDYSPDSNYDFIAATAGILELKNDKYHIGLVMMAYSYDDDLDGLSNYLEDSLMEVYQAGFNDYKIINFHIATEGFSPDKDYATVLAGIAF